MQELADTQKLNKYISSLATQIESVCREYKDSSWAVVGVRSRGDIIAQRLVEQIKADNLQRNVGVLDITLYRDDLSEIGAQAIVGATQIPYNLDGLNVVLVDDVIMTGRSVRAGLQSLMDLGRPSKIWLAALVDIGRRELPIAPDFVGVDFSDNSDVKNGGRIEVKIMPFDDEEKIFVVNSQAS